MESQSHRTAVFAPQEAAMLLFPSTARNNPKYDIYPPHARLPLADFLFKVWDPSKNSPSPDPQARFTWIYPYCMPIYIMYIYA